MTPQEQEMIGGLIDRVQKTQLAEKDMDAEQMLQQGLGRNPDSLYILAQTVLVQQYALDQAQAQLTDARQQIEQMQQHPEPKHATSFLGGLLGRNDPLPPPPPSVPMQAQGYPPFTPVNAPQQYAPVQYGEPVQYGAPPAGGGFLRGAMQTAAGVAAGALAFEGVESLMHGFGHAAGYGQEFGGFGGQQPEVVNNYYGDDRGGREGGVSSAEREEGGREDRDLHSGDRDSLYGSADDSTANFDDSSNFDDNNGSDDGGNFDDTSFNDDSSFGGDDNSF